MVGVFVCIFCFLISHTEGVIFRMFPEIMYTLARGVATSRSFSTTAFTSARVFNAPKKFRVTEEQKVKEVKVPKGDFRGEVSGYREERVVLSDDGAIIACWHPQPKFPYELSRPIPRETVSSASSVMNTQVTDDMKELFHHKPERFQRRDLMRITSTTKHQWFAHPHSLEREKRIRRAQRLPKEKPFL